MIYAAISVEKPGKGTRFECVRGYQGCLFGSSSGSRQCVEYASDAPFHTKIRTEDTSEF